MRYFVFQSKWDSAVMAFTTEGDGANLPDELAPWLPVDDPAIQVGESLEKFRGDANELLGGIGQDGFYFARIEVGYVLSDSVEVAPRHRDSVGAD